MNDQQIGADTKRHVERLMREAEDAVSRVAHFAHDEYQAALARRLYETKWALFALRNEWDAAQQAQALPRTPEQFKAAGWL
jgi:hypothetical protein